MPRKDPTELEMYLRVLGRDVLRMCILLLESLAGKYSKVMAAEEIGDLKSRKRFVQKNAELQGQLGKFFASYHHLCPACDSCCFSVHIPYWQLDMVLYGLPERPEREITFFFFLHQIGNLLYRCLRVPLRLIRLANLKADEPKPYLGNRKPECLGVNGCKIPFGKRPAYCLFFACSLFMKNMDWAEYWRYLWLNLKFLLHLTVALMAVAAEWRQQVGAPAALKGRNVLG